MTSPVPIRLFVSWSGSRSRQVADAMCGWLRDLFGERLAPPFISADIEKGQLWFDRISHELSSSHMALFCLTPENLASPWLHFEAGAVARMVATEDGSHSAPQIFTYLFNVPARMVTGPLAQYQATLATREDTRALVESIVALLPEGGAWAWRDEFSARWPLLEAELESIQPELPSEVVAGLEQTFRRKTFREALVDCTNQTWAERYAGAREVLRALHDVEADVEQRCRPYHVDLYRELLGELDGYAMSLSALLLQPRRFELDEEGRLDVPAGLARGCERRRESIEQLVSKLLDPLEAPEFDESWRFSRMRTFDARRSLVHRKKHFIDSWAERRPINADNCRTSTWDFDRIAFYLVEHRWPQLGADQLVKAITLEVDRLDGRGDDVTLIPLYHALDTLEAAIARSGGVVDRQSLEAALTQAKKLPQLNTQRDDRAQVVRAIDRISATLPS